jgi:MATE family multidrug resistance protein
MNAYLNSQRMMKPGAMAAFVVRRGNFSRQHCCAGAMPRHIRPPYQATLRPHIQVLPVHIGVCYVVFGVLGSDFLGGAKSMSFSGFANTLTLLSIIFFGGLHRKTWGGWSPRCVEDWWPFVKLAIAGVISLSEWWASEICILLAGLLPRPEYTVAAMSIFQITLGQCFYFPLGIGIAVSTRISNHLGAGRPAAARLAGKAACLFGACTLATLFTLVQLLRHRYWHVYTEDSVLGEMLASNFFVMAFYVVGDGMCVIFGSILRGCALNVMAAKVVVFSYYVIGLPAACAPIPARCKLILSPTLVISVSVPPLSLPLSATLRC